MSRRHSKFDAFIWEKLGCGSLVDSCGAFFKLIHSFITFQEGFKVVDL